MHSVGCEETWPEVDPQSSQLIDKPTQHGWLSSQPLDSHNVHARCNLGARQRWGSETRMQVEKCPGYYYEHAFSYTGNARQGYHYLMRLAPLLNALALATKRVASQIRTPGVQACLRLVRERCAHRWLQREWIARFHAMSCQLRLE